MPTLYIAKHVDLLLISMYQCLHHTPLLRLSYLYISSEVPTGSDFCDILTGNVDVGFLKRLIDMGVGKILVVWCIRIKILVGMVVSIQVFIAVVVLVGVIKYRGSHTQQRAQVHCLGAM